MTDAVFETVFKMILTVPLLPKQTQTHTAARERPVPRQQHTHTPVHRIYAEQQYRAERLWRNLLMQIFPQLFPPVSTIFWMKNIQYTLLHLSTKNHDRKSSWWQYILSFVPLSPIFLGFKWKAWVSLTKTEIKLSACNIQYIFYQSAN